MTMPSSARSTRLAEAQNWRCCYCGFVMLSPAARPAETQAILGPKFGKAWRLAYRYRLVTKDHIRPRCDGGSDGFENLVAACAFCNEYRGNRSAEEAYGRIRRLIRRGSHPHQVWHQHRRFPRMTRLPALLRPGPLPFPDLPPPAPPTREPAGAPFAPSP